jgi:DNA-binding SARP family transcriptional activator/predicted ATPase
VKSVVLESQAATIDVRLLQPFAVTVDGRAMTAGAWRLRHPRQLFQMLCLRRGHRLHRDEVVEALWPKLGAPAAANRLYHTLHILRGEFVVMGLPEHQPVLLLEAGTVRLNPQHEFRVDVQAFDELVAQCRAGATAARALLERAAALVVDSVPPLATLPAGWFDARHKELRDNSVWVLEQLAARCREQARLDQAIAALQKLLTLEPCDELAHRALMELFDAAGQPEKALLQYAACEQALQRELAVQPAAATQALRRLVASKTAGTQPQLVAESPDQGLLQTPPPAPQSLSAPLLGRQHEMTELAQWLGDSQCRLITVAAPAGTGKTSVALALAQAVAPLYRDGVLVVRLTHAESAAAVEPIICQAAGFLVGAQGPEQALRDGLAGKQLLLVLDRFEHVVSAADRMARLLASAPALQVVVTSQCALGCQAERVYELKQLADASPAAASQLFVQTALTAGALAEHLHDTATTAALCRQLGGNALAIQLAAAQLAKRSIPQLLAGIGRLLDFPQGSSAVDEPQQRSLRSAIEWSVSLLEPATAHVLQALAVFQRSFTFDDALAVVSAGSNSATTRLTLQTLLERHLVDRETPSVSAQGPARFIVPDAIHHFLLEQAGAFADAAMVRTRHAQVFRQRTAEAYRLLTTGQNAAASALFEPAQSNIDRALEWALAGGDIEHYLHWCQELSALQLSSGQVAQTIQRLQRAVRLPVRSAEEHRHSAWCCYLLSRALHWVNDRLGLVRFIRLARQRGQRCADPALLERIGTHLAAVRAEQLFFRAAGLHVDNLIRLNQGNSRPARLAAQQSLSSGVWALRGDYPRALAAAEASLHAALSSGNQHMVWLAQQTICEAALRHGLMDRAREHVEQCRSIEGAGRMPQTKLRFIAFHLHFECEEYAQARASLLAVREAGALSMPSHDQETTLGLEFIALETGATGDVVALLSATEKQVPYSGEFSDFYAQLHCYRLRLLAERGDSAGARESLASVLPLLRRSRNRLWVSWLATALAGVATDSGQLQAARSLLQHAQRLQTEAGIVPSQRQRTSWQRLAGAAGPGPGLGELEPRPDTPGTPVILVLDLMDRWARQTLLRAGSTQTAAAAQHQPQNTIDSAHK